MTHAADLPPWAALTVALLLLLGAGLTLIGSVGLLRFRSFYERVHAPPLARRSVWLPPAGLHALFFGAADAPRAA